MDPTSYRIWAAVFILFITVVATALPWSLESRNPASRDNILALFSFVTGGVFLGAGLLHMLPDANEQWATVQSSDFPIINLVACAGFTLVWAVEKIHSGKVPESAQDKDKVLAVMTGAGDCGAEICYVSVDPTTTYGEGARTRRGSRREREQQRLLRPEGAFGSYGGTASTAHDHVHSSLHHHHLVIPATNNLLMPLLLSLMFSIHSLVAGLALGVQDGLSGSALSIFIAILAHKVVEAMAVSSKFVQEEVAMARAGPVLAVYCLMTPLGIVIGMMATRFIMGTTSSVFQCQAQAFAAGSFIFLAFHSVQEARALHLVTPGLQIILWMTGIACMAVLAIYV